MYKISNTHTTIYTYTKDYKETSKCLNIRLAGHLYIKIYVCKDINIDVY